VRGDRHGLLLHLTGVFLFYLLIKRIPSNRIFNNFQKKYFPGSLFSGLKENLADAIVCG
jgi:hypothetical protein